MKNYKGIEIRYYSNKDRSHGRRGSKKRYSLWKAENNRDWELRFKNVVYWCCAKWDLDPNTFINWDDPERDMWNNAQRRVRDYLKANNRFEHTERGCKRLQVERIEAFYKQKREEAKE